MIAAIRGGQVEMHERAKEFRVIPGYGPYAVNCDGSMVKHVIAVDDKRPIRKLFLKQGFHPSPGKEYPEGYWYVTLCYADYSIDSISPVRVAVHRLVALAWVDNDDPINNVWVNHEDGNKINNHFTNLKWGTVQYNIQHAHDNGLCAPHFRTGADHPMTGYKHSEASKKAMRDAKRGENHPKFKGYYITPAGRFTSIGAAVEANGSYTRQVKQYCETNSPGWSFEPKKAKRKYTKLSRIVSK